MEDHVQISLSALDRSRQILDNTRAKLDRIDDANKRLQASSTRMDRALTILHRVGSILTSVMAKLAATVTIAAHALSAMRSAVSGMFGTVSRILGPLAAFLSVIEAIRQVKLSTQLAAGIEALQVRLEFMLGSAREARQQLQTLLRLTTTTPFSLKSLEQATRNFEMTSKGIVDTNRALTIASDIAVVTGRDIEFVSEKIGQLFEKIRKGGEIETEGLKGILSAGDVAMLLKLRNAGATTGEQIEFVIARMERFSGATERYQQTLEGTIKSTKSWIDLLRIQFGAPIRDAITPMVTAVNQKLNEMFSSGRATQFGQNVAAMLGVVVDAFKAGRIGELIGLSIQAGLEMSAQPIRRVLDTMFGVDAVSIIMRASVGLGEAFVRIGQIPIDTITAGLTVAISHIEVGVQKLTNALAHMLAAIVNTIGDKLVKLINFAIEKANIIRVMFGSEDLLEPLEFERVGVQETHGTAIKFADALALAQQDNAQAIQTTVAWMQKQVDESERIMRGSEATLATELQAVSAKEKLLTLIDQQKAKLEEIKQVSDEVNGAGQAKQDPRGGAWGFELGASLDKFVGDLGNRSRQAANMIQGTLGAAINGISQGITGLITGTATWGQVFMQVGTQIISTLVQIGVEMVAGMILRKVIGATLMTQAATEGATLAAAYAPAAATAGAATMGTGTAIGVTLTIAAILAGIAALAGAFASGGIIPGAPSNRDNRLALVATGEGIIPASVTSRMGPAMFEYIRSGRFLGEFGRMGGGIAPRSVASSSFATGGIVGAAPAVSVQAPEVHIGILNSREDLKKWAMSREGRKFLVDLQNQNKTELGIRS